MATIYKRGKAWRASIRIKGVSISRTLDSKVKAEEWAEAEETRIIGGASKETIVEQPVSMTMKDLFDRYSTEVSEKRKPKARIAEQNRLRMLGRFPVFQKPVLELTSKMVGGWKDERLKTVTGSTVCRELAAMSGVITCARDEWDMEIPNNPFRSCKHCKWPPYNPPRERRVSEDERAAIAEQLGWDRVSQPVTKDQWVAWAHSFAIETMMRRGEILDLTWGHVNPAFLVLTETKNGDRNVKIPVSKKAKALLALLAPGKGKQRVVPVCEGTFASYFYEAAKGAKLDDMHFHDTRREGITRAVPKFKSPIELAGITRHHDLKLLQKVYFAPTMEDLAAKLDAD